MRWFAALGLLLSLAPAVHAAPAGRGDPLDALLLSCVSRDSLRERLLDYAAQAPNRRSAAVAWYYRGLGFERAAQPESAIANYRRASSLAQMPLVETALVDALFRRHGPGDAAEAIAALAKLPSVDEEPGSSTGTADPARLGWAYVLSGETQRGLDLLAPLEQRLAKDPMWSYRLARTYVQLNKTDKALPYLLTLNATARGQDFEIVSMLDRAHHVLGENARVRVRTLEVQQERDDIENRMLARLKGRRVRLRAGDGAMIGGAAFADSAAKRPARAAIVLASLGDDLTDYDSLTVALRAGGFAVLVLDPRGSGWSVAPEFPSPDSWQGRQDAIGARVVRDVRDALTAFARVASVDTTQVLLVGVVTMAPYALRAAGEDARFSAVALLDPLASPVDRAVTIDAARRMQLPCYIQVSVMGRGGSAFADTLFRACLPRVSRLSDSIALGSGAAAFGSRPDITPRFVRWLGETYAARPVKRVIPRTRSQAR